MSTLSINMTTQGSMAGALQQITVRHMAAYERSLTGKPCRLGISPGVMLLLPTGRDVEVIIGPETFNIPQGVALLAAGDSPKTLLFDARDGQAIENEVSVRLLELAVLCNEATTLRECLAAPCLLDYEGTERLARLHGRLTSHDRTLRLPGESVDIAMHCLAVALVTEILATLGGASRYAESSGVDRRLLALKKFLVANLDKRVSAVQMASHVGLSAPTLARWTRTEFNASPAQYFRRLRLDRALELLAQDAGSIDEIAARTGFSDRYHLGKEFKKRYGLTPAKYMGLCRKAAEGDFRARAVEHYHHGRFEAALADCETGLRSAHDTSVKAQLRYQKGLCLQAVGRNNDAIQEWRALADSELRHQAGLTLCDQLFRSGMIDETLAELEDLAQKADRSQIRDVVKLWMDQASALKDAHRAQPLRSYLSLRKRRFARDIQSQAMTIDLLRQLGEDLDVLEHCAEEHAVPPFNALRRAGLLDEAIERYRSKVSADAIFSTLSRFGRYGEVLAAAADVPIPKVHALVALGRPQEAIDRYPRHCARACLAMGRYEELLERFPPEVEMIPEYIYALHALQRTEALLTVPREPAWIWMEAQLYACPESIMNDDSPEAFYCRTPARLLVVLQRLESGRVEEARKILDNVHSIRSPDFWWAAHDGVCVFVSSLTHAFLGNRERMDADMDEIISHHRFKDGQELWHNASLLTGTITANEYRRQPQQLKLPSRLAFVEAVAADLAGQHDNARRDYTRFLSDTQPYPHSNLLFCRFATWRLLCR